MNKVKLEDLETLIDNAPKEHHIFFNKVLVVEYLLPNGFSVQGRAPVVDPKNFDIEIGRKIAREDAIDKLWLLEGYLLQQRLHDEGKL
jgi:hypothetical protein